MKRAQTTLDEIKEEIIDEIFYDVEFHGWYPKTVQGLLKISQSDYSDLKRKILKRFSVDRLITFLQRLGHKPGVYITK